MCNVDIFLFCIRNEIANQTPQNCLKVMVEACFVEKTPQDFSACGRWGSVLCGKLQAGNILRSGKTEAKSKRYIVQSISQTFWNFCFGMGQPHRAIWQKNSAWRDAQHYITWDACSMWARSVVAMENFKEFTRILYQAGHIMFVDSYTKVDRTGTLIRQDLYKWKGL